jgi:hypothetical protein
MGKAMIVRDIVIFENGVILRGIVVLRAMTGYFLE